MGEGLEVAALRKDGSTFPVDIALGPLAGEDGPLVSAAIRDVTERKRCVPRGSRPDASTGGWWWTGPTRATAWARTRSGPSPTSSRPSQRAPPASL